MMEEQLTQSIKKLRENSDTERKFDQTVDLIVNLKNFDVRRESFNTFIALPYKVKDKKVLGFFETKSDVVDTVLKDEFSQFKEKKDFRSLIKKYDFFIAQAKLMPAVATTFGRALGPVGKMPSPQLGILPNNDEDAVKALVAKINNTIRIRVKEPSIKCAVGKQSLKDEQLAENVLTVYKKIEEMLPKGKDNIRSVQLKLTMGKPVAVEV
jgi:large subunit ribosomal protein L1